MNNQIEAEVDAPEVDGADGNAPELTEEQQKQFEDARKAFLDDDNHIRFVDSPSNWVALLNYLDSFTPSLPLSPAALSLSYEQLSQSGDLDLEESPTEGEVQEALENHAKRQAERETAKPGEKQTEPQIRRDAGAVASAFRKRRPEAIHYRNGAKVGTFGS